MKSFWVWISLGFHLWILNVYSFIKLISFRIEIVVGAPYTVTLVIAIKELFYLKSKIINEKVFLVYKTSDSVKSFFIILNAGKVLFN